MTCGRDDDNGDGFRVGDVLAVCVVVAMLMFMVAGGMWGCPQYKVWTAEMSGRAALAQAEQDRKIAKYDAEAEIERAHGVAEANRIIGDSLKDNEGYLRYLWIMGLQDGQSEVIYVPTEAQLPILEATRHNVTRKGGGQ